MTSDDHRNARPLDGEWPAAPGDTDRARRIKWVVADGWEPVVRGAGAPNWAHLDRSPNVELVKSNSIRRVWRAVIAGRRVYIKEYAPPTIRERLRRYFRGSVAEMEWRAGATARRLGVPVVPFVAWGKSAGKHFLVSEEVIGAKRLTDAWRDAADVAEPSVRRAIRESLTRAIGELLAAAHARGFAHNDEHPDNVLVVDEGSGRFRAIYVDVAKSRMAEPLDAVQAARCLAQLHQWFQRRATRTMRMRLIRIYCDARAGGDLKAARRWMRNVATRTIDATNELAGVLWVKRDSRILGTNAYFAQLSLNNGDVAHVVTRYRHPDAYPPATIGPLSATEWVNVLGQSGPLKPADVVIRAASAPDDAILRMFVAQNRIGHRDLPCRRPLAAVFSTVATTRGAWFDSKPATMSLTRFLAQHRSDDATRGRVLRALGELVRTMADRGVSLPVATDDAFGIDVHAASVILDEGSAMLVEARDPRPQRLRTTIALHVLVRRAGVFRRTDAVRFLRSAAPWRWRRLWRQVSEDWTSRGSSGE